MWTRATKSSRESAVGGHETIGPVRQQQRHHCSVGPAAESRPSSCSYEGQRIRLETRDFCTFQKKLDPRDLARNRVPAHNIGNLQGFC